MTKGIHWAAAVTFLMAALLTPALAAGGEWQGKVTTADGVKTVMNPAQPFKDPTTIKLEELWRLGGDTDDEDQFFGVIADIDIDEKGNVYLLDSQLAEVKIFTSDGQFVRTIGREGEGPGEFRRPTALFFMDDGNVAVVQSIPGKIVILTREGEPVGDHPLPEPEDGGFQLLQGAASQGGNTVIYLGRTQFKQGEGLWTRSDVLLSIDTAGKELAQYSKKSNTINLASAELDDAKWDTIERRWTLDKSGNVYACESYEDYTITVYNANGSKKHVIKRAYDHRARTGDEKEFMNKMMSHFAQQMPGCKVTINDNCKDIENIYVRDDGAMWVQSADGARDYPDGALGVFDVYNADGQYVRRVTLQGEGDPLEDLYVFVKNRVYVVKSFLQAAMSAQGVEGLYDEEDDAEPMAVICYKLDGDVLAAR